MLIEYPTGKSKGNVQVQIKGPNKAKIYLNNASDLNNLPKSIMNNTDIQKAVIEHSDN